MDRIYRIEINILPILSIPVNFFWRYEHPLATARGSVLTAGANGLNRP
jgi:hypothetical protein